LAGGESDTVTFKTDKMKKGGAYVFYCTFPGHVSMMSGKFKF
jgi:azurin